jgi:hypothetical protein
MTGSTFPSRVRRAAPAVLPFLLIPSLVFAQASWPAKQLVPDEPNGARVDSAFGSSTGLSGARAMVGAMNVDGHGAVYVFQQQGGNWLQTQKLVAPDIAPGHFGTGIAFRSNTALISDNGRDLVYSFERVQGTGPFRATAILRGGVELFGSALALEGCTALISSGAHGSPTGHGYVHVYNRCPSGKWVYKGSLVSPDASPADRFGASLALSGTELLVGAPGTASDAGAAYHYVYTNGSWHLKQKLTQATPGAGNLFGTGVGFLNGFAAVGAPYSFSAGGEGEVSLYKKVNGSWAPSGLLYAPTVPEHGATTQFGMKIKVTADRVYVSSLPISYYNIGSTLTVFRRVGDTVEFEQQFGPGDRYDLIGTDFDVDGRGLVVTNPTERGPVPFGFTGGATLYQIPTP